MTEPKSVYTFLGGEFPSERLEISANYHSWAGPLKGDAPIYIDVLEEITEAGLYERNSISVSVDSAKGIIVALTEIIDYLEAKND